LLSAEDLPTLLHRLTEGMRTSFALQQTRLALLDPFDVLAELLGDLRCHPTEVPGLKLIRQPGALPTRFLHGGEPELGPWSRDRHDWLFDGRFGSVAVLPLRRSDGLVGFLGLGSTEPQRFTDAHATDFLRRLGAIAAVCLENAVNRERMRLTGLTDPLTGLFNRRYLGQRLREEVARAARYGQPLACLFVDADHFKQINDRYGHTAGDLALVRLGEFLREQLRASDIATRYGGEEFAIVLPATEPASARQLAERICSGIRQEPIAIGAGEEIRLTVSIGVASLPKGVALDLDAGAQQLLDAADGAVYRAKGAGRDRVVEAIAAGSAPSGGPAH
jgi:diguanylate cyclase (GGDEF)-like protein